MDYKQSAVEATTAKFTYAASGSAVLLGLTANELAAIGGLAIAFLALIINSATNWYFKSQHLKLAKAKAKAEGAEVEDE